MIPDREGKAGEKATTETGRKADRELVLDGPSGEITC